MNDCCRSCDSADRSDTPRLIWPARAASIPIPSGATSTRAYFRRWSAAPRGIGASPNDASTACAWHGGLQPSLRGQVAARLGARSAAAGGRRRWGRGAGRGGLADLPGRAVPLRQRVQLRWGGSIPGMDTPKTPTKTVVVSRRLAISGNNRPSPVSSPHAPSRARRSSRYGRHSLAGMRGRIARFFTSRSAPSTE